ncbi:MAG: glycine cleavage system protein GcvH [bacterium]|nr:glycine cleavage system protein GcvH [candidate division WOR-3 bacterium]MDH5683980.1 glycine cleavage system protein GcvH [candidate division WOR-3 bacterium]
MSQIPKDLKYTKTHEWVKVEADTATVGITDFAQEQLSDIVYVDLGGVGKKVNQEEAFGTIEAVKAVSDLYAPVSGEVISINEDLKTAPDLVNTEPYGKGWMVKIKISDSTQLDKLLDAKGYEDLVGKSSH